jgi:hypothetical protein
MRVVGETFEITEQLPILFKCLPLVISKNIQNPIVIRVIVTLSLVGDVLFSREAKMRKKQGK